MKTKIKSFALLFVLIVSFAWSPRQSQAQRTYVSFQVFYDQLSAYGQWVDHPDYGYVWYPDVSAGFEPYFTNGHWIFTKFGWMWISDYPWGWATFHYGRWEYDDTYGWFWIPGDVWGPAWVVWVASGGYYGWAPMGPGISIRISFGVNYYRRHRHWIFIRRQYIDRPDFYRYRVRRTDNDLYIKNSRVIENTYIDRNRRATYVAGPRRTDVQRITGRRINPLSIENDNKPGQNIIRNRVRIYRPEVRKGDSQGRKPAPSRVTKQKDIRRSSGRGGEIRQQPQQEKTKQQEKTQDRRRDIQPPKKDVKSQPPPRRDEKTKSTQKGGDRRKTVKPPPKDGKSQPKRRDRSKSDKDKDGQGIRFIIGL